MPDLSIVVCVALDSRIPAETLRSFKAALSASPFVESALEVKGTFDFIIHGRVPSLADYASHVDKLSEPVRDYIARMETNFVARTIECTATGDLAIWLPCAGGRKRVDVCLIDKVVAEGDYMRIYVGDWHCLLHDTIRHLQTRLGERFIHLHRSSLVRIDFIDRLVHDNRRWIARLKDGSQQSVAKSHVAEVIKLISDRPAMSEVRSAKKKTLKPRSVQINEMRMPVAR